MALKSTIHRATVALSHVDRGVYETLQPTLARHPSETPARLVVRLLAFSLCYEDGMAFGRGVSTPGEPDVWICEGDGRIRHWIDVGQPEAARLVKASRQADRVTVFAYGDGLERWWAAQRPVLEGVAWLAVHALEDELVSMLVRNLDRNIRWSLTVSDATLFLDVAGHSLQSTPRVLLAAPSD